MHKFFFSEGDKKEGDLIYLSGNQKYHIERVLRMSPGKKAYINIGEKEHLCRLQSLDESFCVFRILKESHEIREMKCKIHLIQSYIKNDKMEWVLQKATELGVYAIHPFLSSRSVIKIENEQKKKERLQRFEKIVTAAAQQSKRNAIPQIYPIANLNELELYFGEKGPCPILLFYEEEKSRSLKATIESLHLSKEEEIYLVVGPEGGFSEEEVEMFKSKGAHIVSLGSRILRSETASLYGLCVMNYIVE